MRVAPTDDQEWKLEGLLTREGESMAAGKAELLVPGGLVLTETKIARLQDYDAFEWVDVLDHRKRV